MKTKILLILGICLSFNLFAQDYGTGMLINDEKYNKVPRKATLTRSLYNNLPKKASIKQWAPTPKTQGSYGTCVGWSTTYAGLSIIQAREMGWTDKDVINTNTFSPGFVYKQAKTSTDVDCKRGVYVDDALYALTTKGAPKFESLEEVNCPTTINDNIYAEAKKYTISDYTRIFSSNDDGNIRVEATKKSISENKPVIIGMNTPNSFYNVTDQWIPTEDANETFGGHAMCVVGYDDEKYGGAFEIQNSWGENWGNKGYFWITYENYGIWVKYAYEMIENPTAFKPKDVELSGKLRFICSEGDEMKAYWTGSVFKMYEQYRSGTRFRIYIENNEPAYVYAFGSDATAKAFKVFPHNEVISAALSYSQNEVALPDENHYIEMDNTIGTDYLCVLYSSKKLDFDTILQKFDAQPGNFIEKIKKSVGTDLIDSKDINFTSDKISFKTKVKGKSIVAIIVETQHIK